MNTLYRVIWNPVRNALMVVNELTKRAGKKRTASVVTAAVAAVVLAGAGTASAEEIGLIADGQTTVDAPIVIGSTTEETLKGIAFNSADATLTGDIDIRADISGTAVADLVYPIYTDASASGSVIENTQTKITVSGQAGSAVSMIRAQSGLTLNSDTITGNFTGKVKPGYGIRGIYDYVTTGHSSTVNSDSISFELTDVDGGGDIYFIQRRFNGTLTDDTAGKLTINADTVTLKATNVDNINSLDGIHSDYGRIEFNADLVIDVDAGHVGQVCGLNVQSDPNKPQAVLDANGNLVQIDIKVGSQDWDLYGITPSGTESYINLNGDAVNINLTSDNHNTNKVYALAPGYGGTLTSTANNTITATVTTLDSTGMALLMEAWAGDTGIVDLKGNFGATVNALNAFGISHNVSGFSFGTHAKGGKLNIDGYTDLTVNGSAQAVGLYAGGDKCQTTLNGDFTLTVRSPVLAVGGVIYDQADVSIGSSGNVLIDVAGDGEVRGLSVNNAKLTLGSEGHTVDVKAVGTGSYAIEASSRLAEITLKGKTTLTSETAIEGSGGRITVDGDLSLGGATKAGGFEGELAVKSGTVKLTAENGYWSKANVQIEGGTLETEVVTLEGGLLTLNGGTLVTGLAQVFSAGTEEVTIGMDAVDAVRSNITLENGLLTLTDQGTYQLSLFNSIVDAINNSNVDFNFLTATLAPLSGDDRQVEISNNVVTGSIQGADAVSVTSGKTLTLIDGNATSDIGALTLEAGTTIEAVNRTTLVLGELTGLGTLKVGSSGTAEAPGLGGSVVVGNINGFSGAIVVDPDVATSDAEIHLNGSDFNAQLYAFRGSRVGIDATAAAAKDAAARLGSSSNAVAFAAKPFAFGPTGGMLVDPLLQDADVPSNPVVAGAAVVHAGGILIVDQAAATDAPFIGGDLVVEEGGELGVVNAKEGAFKVAESGNTDSIVLDNPFLDPVAFEDGVLTIRADAENMSTLVTSFGMQAMTRRVDSVLAASVADRTSFDQRIEEGISLWADVSGERYEADKLDNGGSFKTDMGYAVFGGDIGITPSIRAGAAVQYATGSLRSDVAKAKNDFDAFGFTAYGSWQPCAQGMLVGELAYVQGTSELSNTIAAASGDVDTTMYSAGIRAQYKGTLGQFSIVPSIGLRVSRLETDAFALAGVNVEKQKQTLVQVPLAVRINGAEFKTDGWQVAPSFKLAYVPTFGDKEITIRSVDSTVIDTSPVQGEFGIRAANGNLMLNADMLLGGGKDGASSIGAKIGVRYLF